MLFNFKVQNLKCGGCANSIKKKLMTLPYVLNVQVDAETANVEVDTENEAVVNQVKTSLHDLGYPVEGDKNAFSSKAKSFISCATGRLSS